MVIISDTSPITNLLAIEHIHLLPALYSRIIIPEGVREELLRVESRKEKIQGFLSVGWLEVRAISNFQLYEDLLTHLDKGESQAITLGVELKADLLLMDETKGRVFAKNYGLPVTGLLGMLIEAKSRSFIPSVKDLLDGLIEKAGFYMDEKLYKTVLDAAGEK